MKKGIIVVSFGTSYEKARKLSIESIENRIKEKYKDYLVLRAFTSQMIIEKLKKRDNYIVNNIKDALDEMKFNGVKDIYIQPLHIIPGHEYEKIQKQVKIFLNQNKDYSIKIGKPLLYDDKDYKKVVRGLGLLALKPDEAIIFMGHGTDHEADKSYEKLEKTFKEEGYENVFVATVEGKNALEDIIPILKDREIEKIILRPFMLVAGDHAINDMASKEEDSWRSILEREGFIVEPILQGLGEVKAIQDIYLEHLQYIINKKSI